MFSKVLNHTHCFSLGFHRVVAKRSEFEGFVGPQTSFGFPCTLLVELDAFGAPVLREWVSRFWRASTITRLPFTLPFELAASGAP